MITRKRFALFLLRFGVGVATSSPAYAASVSFSSNCQPTGSYTTFGTFQISYTGSYVYTVLNLTTGVSFSGNGPGPVNGVYASGAVDVHGGDIVRVTVTLDDGEIFTNYPCGGSSGTCQSGDGRLNCDAAQTVAVYCLSDGSVKILAIDAVTNNGTLAFIASPTEIAKVPAKPTKNTAIKSGMDATLYRLTSGELQVNRNEPSGKPYVFIFNGCLKNS